MAGVWSGYLTFGLVTIPVRLVSGARSSRISFHMLHASDRARLQQQMVCSRDGEVVPRSETVRGYEYAKGEYVVIPEEQIKAAAPPTERQIEILEFCRAEEIDPICFESSYFLMPEAPGRRPYALLLRAMRDTGCDAVSQLSMHNREYLSLLRPSRLAGVPEAPGAGLLLHTLYYKDEVRVPDGFGVMPAGAVVPSELRLARQLIEGLTRPFQAARFEDHYRKNLEAVVAAALEGRPAPAHAPARKLAPVTDLMVSLKASLQQRRKPPAAAPAKPRRAPRAA